MRNSEVSMNECSLFPFPLLKIVFISLCNLFLVVLLLHYFVMGLIRFLLGSIIIRRLYLFSLCEYCCFLLFGQRLRIDIL